MGVNKLTGPELPPYPHGVAEDDPAWPVDSHSKSALLRFRWDQTEASRTNATGLKKVIGWIHASGRTTVPSSRTDLDCVLDYDLTQRIETRWKYLRQEVRKHERATTGNRRGAGQVLRVSPAGTDEEDDEGGAPNPGEGQNEEVADVEALKEHTGTRRQILVSRARGVSTAAVCERARCSTY